MTIRAFSMMIVDKSLRNAKCLCLTFFDVDIC